MNKRRYLYQVYTQKGELVIEGSPQEIADHFKYSKSYVIFCDLYRYGKLGDSGLFIKKAKLEK